MFASLKKLLTLSRYSAERVAFTVCLGLFIGCSPFLGFQTPLVFVLGWALGLPVSLLFAVVYTINNPCLTTIPIAVANYLTGYLLFTYVIPFDVCGYNPSWFAWIADKVTPTLERWVGISTFCFWHFIIGGVIFALVVSFPFYPLILRGVRRMRKKSR